MVDGWLRELVSPYDLQIDHKTKQTKLRKRFLFWPRVIGIYDSYVAAMHRKNTLEQAYFRDMDRFQ